MITLLLAFIAITITAGIGLGAYSYVKATRFIQDSIETLHYCFEHTGEDGFTPLIRFVDQTTEVTAQKIGVSVQAAIKGSIGGTMKGVNAQLENYAAENDQGAALMTALPKSLRKNPIALMGLQMLMQNMAKGVPGKAPENGRGITPQAKFNL